MPKIIDGPVLLKTFKQFLKESNDREQALRDRVVLFEHTLYKRIPGTANSYRQDPENTNSLTMRHSHVYAKLHGRGKELYAVNWDGSGHDGSSGRQISAMHADHFRSLGYTITATNILESVDIDDIDVAQYCLLIFKDS